MACCFIGHRKIEDKPRVKEAVEKVVGELIEQKGERTFLFGSRSEFDDICHAVVTEFQKTYPDIVRINYNCKSEYVVKKEERAQLEKGWRELFKKEVTFNDYEQGKISDRVYNAGKASYVERNQDMINDSEVCVMFYRSSYSIARDGRKTASGTEIAYKYAMQRKKTVINIAK